MTKILFKIEHSTAIQYLGYCTKEERLLVSYDGRILFTSDRDFWVYQFNCQMNDYINSSISLGKALSQLKNSGALSYQQEPSLVSEIPLILEEKDWMGSIKETLAKSELLLTLFEPFSSPSQANLKPWFHLEFEERSETSAPWSF